MPATVEQREAISLIADWSKWLIAIQTAGVGFVASLMKPDKPVAGYFPAPPPQSAEIAFFVGLATFVFAVVAAGALQSGLPSAVTDLDNDKLWERGIYFLNRPFGKLWVAAELQFGLFLVGIAALSACVYFLRG